MQINHNKDVFMEAFPRMSQESKDNLAGCLEAYGMLNKYPAREKFVIIVVKRNDREVYMTAGKANWLVLKIRAFLHLLGINTLYHSARQSDKNRLIKDIISILTDESTTRDVKDKVIRFATPFFDAVKHKLDDELKKGFESAVSNAHSMTYKTSKDFLALFDRLGYARHVLAYRLADYLQERATQQPATFTVQDDTRFSPQEVTEFNNLIRDFLRARYTHHLDHLPDRYTLLNPMGIFQLTHLEQIYHGLKQCDSQTVNMQDVIREYLYSCNFPALVAERYPSFKRYDDFVQHLVDKAHQQAFLLPKEKNSHICVKFFETELREYIKESPETETE